MKMQECSNFPNHAIADTIVFTVALEHNNSSIYSMHKSWRARK